MGMNAIVILAQAGLVVSGIMLRVACRILGGDTFALADAGVQVATEIVVTVTGRSIWRFGRCPSWIHWFGVRRAWAGIWKAWYCINSCI